MLNGTNGEPFGVKIQIICYDFDCRVEIACFEPCNERTYCLVTCYNAIMLMKTEFCQRNAFGWSNVAKNIRPAVSLHVKSFLPRMRMGILSAYAQKNQSFSQYQSYCFISVCVIHILSVYLNNIFEISLK